MESVGPGHGEFKLYLQIGSAQQLTFVFQTYDSATDTYTDEDISGKTFSFCLRKYKGQRRSKVIFCYTNNNGITIPVYYTNQILVSILAADVTEVEEGEYYFELRREDLDKPKCAGLAYLSYDARND